MPLNPTAVHLGHLEQIVPGHGRCFVVQEREIAVFRPRTGGLFAVENRCPHRQGPLTDGIIGKGQVVCPLHGHQFDLESGQGSEGQECVRTFPVWEENGEMILDFK